MTGEFDKYLELGIANKEVIRLASNWCAHLDVHKAGGTGLLEESTGLPIGFRTFACKHATGGGTAAMDLRHVALDFYDRNCVDCPHRQPVGFPNLSQLVGERDRANELLAAKAERESEEAARALESRRQKRADVRRIVDPPRAGIVDLLGELDAGYTADLHQRLAKLAATVPHQFDPSIQSLLYDLIDVGGEGRTHAALEALARTNAEPKRLVQAAIIALSRHEATAVAGEIVSLHLDETVGEQIDVALPAIFAMASPVLQPFARDVEPRPAALERAFALYPRRCERALTAMFAIDSESYRIVAAGCVEHLVKSDAELGPRVAPSMLDSMALRDEEFGTVAGARRAVIRALAEAFKVSPIALDRVLQDAYSRGVARASVLDAYAEVCGEPRGIRPGAWASTEAVRLAFQRLLHALIDPQLTGDEVRSVTDFLRDEAKDRPEILVENVEALVGSVALLLRELDAANAQPSLLVHPKPDYLAILQQRNRAILLDSAIRSLTALVGLAAKTAPARVLPLLTDIFDKAPPDESAFRAYLVRMLTGAAQDRAVVAQILPQIYRALLDPSQLVRSHGARAYGVIAKFGIDDLPALMHECFLNLASDAYVIVHVAFAEVLKDLDVPADYRPRAVMNLWLLLQGYVTGGQSASHIRLLIEAFANQYDAEFPDELKSKLVKIAAAMPVDDAAQTVIAVRWRLGAFPDFLDLVVRLAADATLSEYHRDDLLQIITDCDPPIVAHHAAAMRRAVALRVQEMPFPRQNYDDDYVDVTVEKLTRADDWDAATQLLTDIEQLYATSTLTLGAGRYVMRQRLALSVENASDGEARERLARDWLASNSELRFDGEEAFMARLAAVIAIADGRSGRAVAFADISTRLRTISTEIADLTLREEYVSLARVLDAIGYLTAWRDAVRSAAPEAERFRRAAVEAAKDVANGTSAFNDAGVTEAIRSVTEIDAVPEILAGALSVRLPVPLRKQEHYPSTPPGPWRRGASAEMRDVTIAFVSFEFEGKQVAEPQLIGPNRMHDLKIAVAVSEWPEAAQTLCVDVLSVEPPSTYELPAFRFARLVGAGPYRFEATGRVVLRVAQSLLAAPLEFQYRAYFLPESADVRVSIEGQRKLQIHGHDPLANPQTGHAGLDQKLFEIRTAVRRMNISDAEAEDFMRLMISLSSVAWRAVAGNIFRGDAWPEKRFHEDMADRLRADPRIGSELEDHPHIAAGITDLSFRRIRTELKVESGHAVTVEEAVRYSQQTAQYAAGSDRRTGVICILDSSEKAEAPGAIENDIDVVTVGPPTGGSVSLLLGVVIIRGNLRAPSDFSR